MKTQRRDAMQEGTVKIIVAQRHGVALAPKEAMGNTTAMCKGNLYVARAPSMLGHGSDRRPYTMPSWGGVAILSRPLIP
jgi:hypothetical protein